MTHPTRTEQVAAIAAFLESIPLEEGEVVTKIEFDECARIGPGAREELVGAIAIGQPHLGAKREMRATSVLDISGNLRVRTWSDRGIRHGHATCTSMDLINGHRVARIHASGDAVPW